MTLRSQTWFVMLTVSLSLLTATAGAARAQADGVKAPKRAAKAAAAKPRPKPEPKAAPTPDLIAQNAARPGGPGPAMPTQQPPPPPGPQAQGQPNPDDLGGDADLYRCKNLPKKAKFKVTLKPETELKELVQWAMSFTCRNFIYGQGITGRASKVTIIAPSEMTPDAAWKLFLVSLQTMNLNVVPKGQTLEIIEAATAREKPLPVYRNGAPDSDQIVRAVLRPENITTDDLSQMCNSLKSSNGTCTPVPSMGVVIVTDFGSIITRITEVMRMVDLPNDGEKIYIIPVHYADVTELVTKLNEIFVQRPQQGGAPPQQPVRANGGKGQPARAPTPQPAGSDVDVSAVPSKVIADERTNSIIVIASKPAYDRIVALVKRLDTAIEGGEGRIHVYRLANADAEEMSGTLGQLISGQQAARPGAGQPGQPGRPAGAPAAGNVGGGSAALEGQVKISFDKPNNALIIVSSNKDYVSLKKVIIDLDQPRRQVFVEATIMEVSVDNTRKLGVAWHGGIPYTVDGKDSLVVAGVQHPQLGTLALNPANLQGGVGGLFGPQVAEATQILGVSIPSIGLLFQLLQTDNNLNVLSAPHLLAIDNEPAEIDVGQNIPIQSGPQLPSLAAAGAAGAGAAGSLGIGLGSNVQRQKVGLKLTLTPHVNDSDIVRMDVELDVEDIASENFGGLGASWSTRHAKTKVVIRDQEPVVIGGMIQSHETITESKVPLLGDIPILGYLFKYSSKTKVKTNLLIVLTPYVIRDQSDLHRIFERKMRERREFIRSYTAFETADWKSDVDYSRKRGLIEEINRTVRSSDEDAQMQREIDAASMRQDSAGPVEMPQPGAANAPANPSPPPRVPPHLGGGTDGDDE